MAIFNKRIDMDMSYIYNLLVKYYFTQSAESQKEINF